MTDEADFSRLEQLLEDTKELAEENNRLLRELRRNSRIAFWAKALIWAAVIILPFVFLGPLLRTLVPVSDTSRPGVGVFGLPSPAEFQKMLETYQGGAEGE